MHVPLFSAIQLDISKHTPEALQVSSVWTPSGRLSVSTELNFFPPSKLYGNELRIRYKEPYLNQQPQIRIYKFNPQDSGDLAKDFYNLHKFQEQLVKYGIQPEDDLQAYKNELLIFITKVLEKGQRYLSSNNYLASVPETPDPLLANDDFVKRINQFNDAPVTTQPRRGVLLHRQRTTVRFNIPVG